MADMLCSLCRKMKKAKPLDMDDIFFGAYVKTARMLKLSKHTENLGICKDCMKEYLKIKNTHNQKIMTYGLLAVIFAVLYLYFTANIIFSILIALFVASLSLFSYCPPLKE